MRPTATRRTLPHPRVYLALLPSGPDAVRRLKLTRVRAAVRRTPSAGPVGPANSKCTSPFVRNQAHWRTFLTRPETFRSRSPPPEPWRKIAIAVDHGSAVTQRASGNQAIRAGARRDPGTPETPVEVDGTIEYGSSQRRVQARQGAECRLGDGERAFVVKALQNLLQYREARHDTVAVLDQSSRAILLPRRNTSIQALVSTSSTLLAHPVNAGRFAHDSGACVCPHVGKVPDPKARPSQLIDAARLLTAHHLPECPLDCSGVCRLAADAECLGQQLLIKHNICAFHTHSVAQQFEGVLRVDAG